LAGTNPYAFPGSAAEGEAATAAGMEINLNRYAILLDKSQKSL